MSKTKQQNGKENTAMKDTATFLKTIKVSTAYNHTRPPDKIVEEPGFKNVKNKHLGMSPF